MVWQLIVCLGTNADAVLYDTMFKIATVKRTMIENGVVEQQNICLIVILCDARQKLESAISNFSFCGCRANKPCHPGPDRFDFSKSMRVSISKLDFESRIWEASRKISFLGIFDSNS